MKDKVTYIEIEDKKYPICLNLNVMEELQDQFGSITEWGNIVENKDNDEPRIKELKIGLMIMINEAIDMENDNLPKEERKELLTSKQVGRIISNVGFKKITEIIMEITKQSTQTDNNEKNV